MDCIKKILIISVVIILFNNIYAEEINNNLGLDEYVDVMDEHINKSELRRCC